MPGDKNNKAAKLNCSLVGYESLTDDVKQYDRDNAESALALIQGQ